MRTNVTSVAVLALAIYLSARAGSHAAPRQIPLEPPASQLAIRAYGMGLLPLDARFERFVGWLSYDPDNRAVCQVELRAEVASLVADDPTVRNRIIGPEFMDAARFPTLHYTGACRPQDKVHGILEMHGVSGTFALTLDWGSDRVSAEGRLLRADWGMTAMPLTGGRTVRIRVSVPLDPPRP